MSLSGTVSHSTTQQALTSHSTHYTVTFGDDLPSQNLVQNCIFPTNHLAGTRKENQTEATLQQKNPKQPL